jgi:mannosyltransferase
MGTALRYWAFAGLFLTAGLILRLDSLHVRAAWYDEVYSLWVASQPAVQILRESATSDPHPPLYYLLLHGWAELAGTRLQAARALSLFLWLAAMLLLWRATSAWFGREAAVDLPRFCGQGNTDRFGIR